jgi:hypothetical protein
MSPFVHIGSFLCAAEFGRYRGIADSGKPSARQIYGFTAQIDVRHAVAIAKIATAAPILEGPAVTVSFGCEFLDAAREGELLECNAEIMRAGGSMIFLCGVLTGAARTLFTFSGTIKRVKRRTPAGNDAG